MLTRQLSCSLGCSCNKRRLFSLAELEACASALTEGQLSMLEQMFPR